MGAGEVTTATCRHCGRTIILGPPTPDPYWYHRHNRATHCWLASDHPTERHLRAEPRG